MRDEILIIIDDILKYNFNRRKISLSLNFVSFFVACKFECLGHGVQMYFDRIR